MKLYNSGLQFLLPLLVLGILSGCDVGMQSDDGGGNDEQLGGEYSIQQVINGRYLDAYGSADNDYGAVTRPVQNNDTQRWLMIKQ